MSADEQVRNPKVLHQETHRCSVQLYSKAVKQPRLVNKAPVGRQQFACFVCRDPHLKRECPQVAGTQHFVLGLTVKTKTTGVWRYTIKHNAVVERKQPKHPTDRRIISIGRNVRLIRRKVRSIGRNVRSIRRMSDQPETRCN